MWNISKNFLSQRQSSVKQNNVFFRYECVTITTADDDARNEDIFSEKLKGVFLLCYLICFCQKWDCKYIV